MKKFLIATLYICTFLNGFPQVPPAEIAAKADEYLSELYLLNRFRGDVLIAKDHKIIYHKAFGLANIEDSIPNTDKTRFPIASLTKAFTAAAILMLAEKNLLTVQDKITKYINDSPAEWKDISIHHLLSHSSGIPDYSEDSAWLDIRSCGMGFHEAIGLFKNKKLLFAPGAKYNYSNSGYVLLGYIIEKLSGQSYEQFITEKIFWPLQMRSSFVDDNKMIIKNRAKGYVREGLELFNFPYLNMEIGKPAGGMISTAEDLLKWDQSFYTRKLISSKSMEAMFTVYAGDYGYGWHIDSLNGAKRITHSGGILGYKTNIDRYVDQKLTIIILCNAYDVFINSAIKDLSAIALGKAYKHPQKRKSIALPTEKLKSYAGKYKTADGDSFLIKPEGDHLVVEYNDKTYKLFAETETAFFSDEYDAQIMFSFESASAEKSLLYNKKIKAVKL